ncbi:MAG: hypothetical protein R2738_09005 [Bacteroides graminisolvens]
MNIRVADHVIICDGRYC